MSDIILVFRDMCEECDEQVGLPHAEECSHDGTVTLAQSTEKGTTVENAEESQQRLMKVNLAARLRSMAGALQMMTGADEQTVKLIFDLKEAAKLLDRLDVLTQTIFDAQSIEEWSVIKRLASEIAGQKAAGADPEPKIA